MPNDFPNTDYAHSAAQSEQRLEAIIKASVVGAEQSSQPVGEAGVFDFSSLGAIDPPYDMDALCRIFEHSNSLRPNVDAYATNIDGFGYRLEPAITLDADDADERIREAIFLERAAERGFGDDEHLGDLEPSDDEVRSRKQQLIRLSHLEKARLNTFFSSCCYDDSFIGLRRRTRQDLEVTGNAYWEVIRDLTGRIAHLVYVPSHTIRLLPLDARPVEVPVRRRISPVSFETTTGHRRFRKYTQVEGQNVVYFKAFGDPRVVSRKTGAVFPSLDELEAADAADAPATELVHFRIHSPRTPYGVPRWVGALLSVLGSRQSEEVNYLYFQNKSVPPLAVLVSGGRLSDEAVPRLERFIEENLRGKKGFHKILILEAESGGGASDSTRAKIELRPLTDAQQHDALFQVYDERNIDKVGAAFRLPRLLRGESRDFNRAVADAQLRFAEDQVFQPERDEFDHFVSTQLLGDMGIRFWRFASQTPVARDPERMTGMVEKLVRVGVLTPEEGRLLAEDIFNREFRKIGDDWVKRPVTLTLAGIQTGVQDVREQQSEPKSEVVSKARWLLNLRDEIAAEEDRLTQSRLELARKYDDSPPIKHISIPDDEFDSLLSGEGAER